MKRFLSIMLAAAMLMSVFCFNVSAAVPTKTGGEWSVLISDNFDGDAATYFTRTAGSTSTITYPAESTGSTNKVVDLQMGTATINGTEYNYDGARIGAGNYTGNILGGTDIVMPNSTVMIEFDMCGKTMTSPLHIGLRVNNGQGRNVKINPNKITADTWYTFRIVVDRAADTDTFTVDNTTVYKKLRDGNDDFVKVEGVDISSFGASTELDYGIGKGSVDSMVVFAVTAHNSYIRPYISTIASTTKSTGTPDGITTHTDYVPEVKDAHYQIDNVTVYAKATETEPELKNGILKYWDMEDEAEVVKNSTSIQVEDTDGDGNLNWKAYAVNSVEGNPWDNHYVKFTPGVAPYKSLADYMVNWIKQDADFAFPETFILSFDANNAALGTGLDFSICGDGTYDSSLSRKDLFPRGTLYFRSHEGILNTWYSYKVVCKGTPNQTGSFTFTVYRRLRGSNDAWTQLNGASFAGKVVAETGTMDYGWGTTISGAEEWINSLQIGANRRGLLDAYTTQDANSSSNPTNETEQQKNHENGVWYIDNVMITEAAALTGDVNVAGDEVTAALNYSTAENSTPILAVYDGTKLVDVVYAPEAKHEGTATLTAKYADTLTEPKVMLYVWDSLANGKPVLAEAIDVTNL